MDKKHKKRRIAAFMLAFLLVLVSFGTHINATRLTTSENFISQPGGVDRDDPCLKAIDTHEMGSERNIRSLSESSLHRGLTGFDGEYALAGDDNLVRVIVLFMSNPASVQVIEAQIDGFALEENVAEQIAEDDHILFREELTALFDAQGRGRAAIHTYEIIREYRRALNGVSMTLPSSMVADIANFTSVRTVLPDRMVTLNPPEIQTVRNPPGMATGRATMRVDDMHALGYRGAGVIIAVLDTGIDYYHPAFAGSFPTLTQMQERNPDINEADLRYGYFKGRSFVMDGRPSNSPMETVGDTDHGTHVAGTIAGRDTGRDTAILGVAPEAHMIHYRVLGPGGGLDSDILAAIEKVTYDRPDVVNMSIGYIGQSSPLDVLSLAVNNVMLANPNITFVLAAGNDGINFSVNSPGTSSLGISVGSADISIVSENTFDINLSWFSSRGPVGLSYEIKPDIIAHGGNVLSAVPSWSSFLIPGTGYGFMSGTSMASPHIAGAAALLIEYSRNNHGSAWTSEEIKSRMMNTAIPMPGYGTFDSGAGYIDVYAAAKNDTVVFAYFDRVATHVDAFLENDFAMTRTGSFSFGGGRLPENNVTHSLDAAIANNSIAQRTYILSHSFTNNPDGAAVLTLPQNVTVNPGEQTNFNATITINATNAERGFYEGYVYVRYGGNIVARLPFAYAIPTPPEIRVNSLGLVTHEHTTVGTWYYSHFFVIDHAPNWRIMGNLPAGMQGATQIVNGFLGSRRNHFRIFGVPTQPGIFTFTIVAETEYGNAEREFTITVRPSVVEENGLGIVCPNFLALVREITGISAGYITPAHVSHIRELDGRYRWMTSLAGIEHFTSLTTLRLRRNGLTELNISGNPNLEILRAYENVLTHLDVSNNPNLRELWADFNAISTLDVSNNPNLEVLAVGFNALTELDVSNNPNLRYLSIEGAAITELDVSNNPNLRQLNVGRNILTSLDLTSNTRLEYLYVSRNFMSSEDDIVGLQNIIGQQGWWFFWPQLYQPVLGEPPQGAVDITADFADPNFLSLVRNMTGIHNRPIYNTDVMHITEVYAQTRNIFSLAGIEHFANLQILFAPHNHINSLDLQSNLWLSGLDVMGNALTTLEFSPQVNLRSSVLSTNVHNNFMSSLDDFVVNWEELLALHITPRFWPQRSHRIISAIVPTNNATNVDVTGEIIITFSEAMDTTAGIVTLTPAGGSAYTLSGIWEGNTVFVVRYTELSGHRVHTVNVSGFRNVAGDVMAVAFTSSFTTGFGSVVPTGIADLTATTTAMLAFLAISAVLWGYVIHHKLRRSNG
jgi:subtilisin family serine protease